MQKVVDCVCAPRRVCRGTYWDNYYFKTWSYYPQGWCWKRPSVPRTQFGRGWCGPLRIGSTSASTGACRSGMTGQTCSVPCAWGFSGIAAPRALCYAWLTAPWDGHHAHDRDHARARFRCACMHASNHAVLVLKRACIRDRHAGPVYVHGERAVARDGADMHAANSHARGRRMVGRRMRPAEAYAHDACIWDKHTAAFREAVCRIRQRGIQRMAPFLFSRTQFMRPTWMSAGAPELRSGARATSRAGRGSRAPRHCTRARGARAAGGRHGPASPPHAEVRGLYVSMQSCVSTAFLHAAWSLTRATLRLSQ
jgi:hypothetical protein